MYASARRFLPHDHRLRNKECVYQGHRYQYRDEERREEPGLKTTQTLINHVSIAKEAGVSHYPGQKGPPLLATLDNFKYDKFNILEWMHNLKRTFECFLDLLVGRDQKFDAKARTSSQEFGVFRPIWETQRLSQVSVCILRTPVS